MSGVATPSGPVFGAAIAVLSTGGIGASATGWTPAEGFGEAIASTGFSTGFGSTFTAAASASETGV